MDNKLVMISIAAVIGIIVLGSVLMPILDDATATTDTITNEGYLRMDHITSSDEGTYTIVWDKATDRNSITVNGVKIPFTNIPNEYIQFNCLFDNNWLIRATSNNGASDISTLQYYTTSGGVTSINNTMTFTASSGSWSLSADTSTTKSGTYTDLYVPALNGPMIMKLKDKPAHVLEDSEFIGFGLTAMNSPAAPGSIISPGLGLLVSGSIEDGATVTPWRGVSNYNSSHSDETVVYTNSSKWIDVYDLEKITFTATLTSTTDTDVTGDTDVTYSYFLVPYQISAERIQHFTDGQNAIFAAMPVMIILAVLLGVVALVIRSRMD